MRRVRLAAGLAGGALVSKDVTSGTITSISTDPLWIKSVSLSYFWEDIAAVIDDGCEFGLAHSDYSSAEIEECLEAQSALDLGDKVAQEQGNRLVRSIGVISNFGSVAEGGSAPFNDGRPTKTKLNWKLSTGDSLHLWIRNGSGTIWTTGSTVQAIGSMWIVDA